MDIEDGLNRQPENNENPNNELRQPPSHDPFDPARLRLSTDSAATLGVKKELLRIPTERPPNESYFRTHPSEAYRLVSGFIELKQGRHELYLVDPSLWAGLATEKAFAPKLLVTTITRQGMLLLWPLRLPATDGRFDDWGQAALEAAELAKSKWTRMTSNTAVGSYDVFTATGNLSEPEWPSLPFQELLRIAFKDRHIDRLDHPVLQRLRGEM
jgi:hypothetical protein